MPVTHATFVLQVHFGLEPATSHREIEALMGAVRRAILDEIEAADGTASVALVMPEGEPDDGWGDVPVVALGEG